MKKILHFFYRLKRIKYKYLRYGTFFQVEDQAVVDIGEKTRIRNSKIYVCRNSTLIIDANVIVKDVNIIVNGTMKIGSNTIIENGNSVKKINIRINGQFFCLNNSRIRSNILIRYGGILNIGCYTNINEDTEIRVDENVTFFVFANYFISVICKLNGKKW